MTGLYRRSLHPGLLVKVGSIQGKGHQGSIQGEASNLGFSLTRGVYRRRDMWNLYRGRDIRGVYREKPST